MTGGCQTGYGCFTHWWAVLPMVPPSREALDWWAKSDGRCTRYGRLKRLWFDYTRLKSPKDDPLRPHEFANPRHGINLTCITWENFGLFHPGDWLPPLMELAGLPCGFKPVDCCWSYEFEAMIGQTTSYKQTDVVVHVRGGRGEEFLLVVEAKRPGDRLKEKCDSPDTHPKCYLDLTAFQPFDHRYLLYLVEESYAPTVRAKVDASDRRWGVATWSQLRSLQSELARESFAPPWSDFVVELIEHSYRGPLAGKITQPEAAVISLGQSLLARNDTPERLRDFVAPAIQYLKCQAGDFPGQPDPEYLTEEPSFSAIHRMPKSQRQSTPERRQFLWRLSPPRAAASA